jgi:hypothetical protein
MCIFKSRHEIIWEVKISPSKDNQLKDEWSTLPSPLNSSNKDKDFFHISLSNNDLIFLGNQSSP